MELKDFLWCTNSHHPCGPSAIYRIKTNKHRSANLVYIVLHRSTTVLLHIYHRSAARLLALYCTTTSVIMYAYYSSAARHDYSIARLPPLHCTSMSVLMHAYNCSAAHQLTFYYRPTIVPLHVNWRFIARLSAFQCTSTIVTVRTTFWSRGGPRLSLTSSRNAQK